MHQLRNRLEWPYSKNRRVSALELPVVSIDLRLLDSRLFYKAATVHIIQQSSSKQAQRNLIVEPISSITFSGFVADTQKVAESQWAYSQKHVSPFLGG